MNPTFVITTRTGASPPGRRMFRPPRPVVPISRRVSMSAPRLHRVTRYYTEGEGWDDPPPPPRRGKLRTVQTTEAHDCSVCMDTIPEKIHVHKLRCRHVFHLECLNEWMKRSMNCPNCRAALLS